MDLDAIRAAGADLVLGGSLRRVRPTGARLVLAAARRRSEWTAAPHLARPVSAGSPAGLDRRGVRRAWSGAPSSRTRRRRGWR